MEEEGRPERFWAPSAGMEESSEGGSWRSGVETGEWSDRTPALATNRCISALALRLLIFRNSDVFLRLSAVSLAAARFWGLFLAALRRVILMEDGSLRRPPVLMEVASSGVALSLTASPPDTSSCSTWVWSRPWTGSLKQWR